MPDSVVKVDKELLKKVEEFVKKNKFLYTSKKQFMNLAIIEFLNRVLSEKEPKQLVSRTKNPKYKNKIYSLSSSNKRSKNKRG